jgi:hypothetical protein
MGHILRIFIFTTILAIVVQDSWKKGSKNHFLLKDGTHFTDIYPKTLKTALLTLISKGF